MKDTSLSTTVPKERKEVDRERWLWAQRWTDLLFLHWQVDIDELLPHVPLGVTVDTHDGAAWVSLVLFRLMVRLRWLPFIPGISSLSELNLRTYVTCRDRPGICFLGLHADNRRAIRLARWLTPLPYALAAIAYRETPGFSFECAAARRACRLAVRFTPTGDVQHPDADSLDAWLLERYHLFASGWGQRLQMATVHHPRWSVRDVRVAITANTIGAPFGLELGRPPDLAHFSMGVAARFGTFIEAAT